MQFSIHYALATGSDISPKEKDRVLRSVWQEMAAEGQILLNRVRAQMDIMDMPEVTLVDGLEFALVGVADYPHDCAIYDYVRCVEIFAVRDGLALDAAAEKVEEVIAQHEDTEDGPIFVYPIDYIDEENMDDYDILNAHEVVFKNTKDS